MTSSAAIIASRSFVDEVWNGDPPSEQRLIELLDRLLASFHETPTAETHYSEFSSPDRDWREVSTAAGKRFPDLGLYSIADPMMMDSGSLSVGDAIDDIADITSDLRETIWYADNFGEDHANSYFREFHFH